MTRSWFWPTSGAGLGMAALVTCAALCLRAEFHVSPGGSDQNQGTAAKPFATLERARDAARGASKVPGEPVTIWLAPGDYSRTDALTLTERDSGVHWRGQKGAFPRLLGGKVLPPLAQGHRATDQQRLQASARERVLHTKIAPANGLMAMKSRGFARPITPSHAELFYEGKPMTLARWPNEGLWEKIPGFPEGGARDDGHGGKFGVLESGFLYTGDRPASWSSSDNMWVHGYWAWDWANSYERVSSIDQEKRLVKTLPPHGHYGFRKGQRYYFVNIVEELDAPGEWFLDDKAGELYFWPPDSRAPSGAPEVLLSTMNQPLVKLEGATNVVFAGIIFEATRANGIEIRGGASNKIEGSVLRNIGNYAVSVNGGARHEIVSCDVFDTGDGGVSLEGGDRRTLHHSGHLVENCHFAGQGRWSKCYVPAVQMSGVGARVRNNLIHDHPHCAILFGGNDHEIALNEIHHIALETGDVGAIYTGRDYTYRGNRILHNYIHETGGVGMGSMGVYMDDCVSGTEIFGNLFYKVQRAAFLGGGRDHRVENNIFVDCNYAVELDGRGLDQAPVWRGMVHDFMRQRLQTVDQALYRERYPAIQTLDAFYGAPGAEPITGAAFKGVPPENNVVANNVAVGKWLNVYWHAKLDMVRLSGNVTNAVGSFVKLPSGASRPADFKLREDSPAWQHGFKAIPLDRIGLYDNELRKALPKSSRWSPRT